MNCKCVEPKEIEVDETVPVSKKEYAELKDRNLFLTCLEMQGVDNWDGYEDAQDVYESISEKFCEDYTM